MVDVRSCYPVVPHAVWCAWCRVFALLPATFVAAFVVACVVLGPAAGSAAETRCGWIENPTPGNWWLSDAQGSWTLRLQGWEWEPLGMDRIPDLTAGEFRRTNGFYGYGCACAEVDTTVFDGERYITAIHTFEQIPLARCDKDPHLQR